MDQFFKVLLHKLKDKNILIIYTSDHGQDLQNNDTLDGVLRTHCNTKNPSIYESTVPFFVIPLGEKYKKDFSRLTKENHQNNINHMSSFYIFPTFLTLMGYDKNETNTYFNKTLFDNLEDEKQVFYSGNLWNEVFSYKNDVTDELKHIINTRVSRNP